MPSGGNLVRSERYRKTPRTPRSTHARYYYTRSLVIDARSKPRQQRSRCQSAPKVMDRSHSRSASPREPARPQHRPPSPPSPPAFENRAYQHDESDPNHNDSFNSNGPHQNGHSKEPNGDTKTLEAVNLELINLTPKNGRSKQKKDVEVDMNASNPYDEYFVPVNEHRKYMRGEKLYVTADKRGEKGGCKRPLCWTLLGLVVAAIVAIIVLAATGILFTNSPTPLEPYNTSVSSARALGGITHTTSHDQELNTDHDNEHYHSHEHDNDHDHEHSQDQDQDHDHEHSQDHDNDHVHSQDHENNHDNEHHLSRDHAQEEATESGQNILHEQNTENVYNQDAHSSHEDNSQSQEGNRDQTTPSFPQQQHGLQMQNDDAPSHTVASDESSDNSMYVPRTLEGELKIDNEEFTTAFEDPESDEYREFVASFSDALKRALFDRNTLDNGDNDIVLEVVKIRSGSIIVTYRIHWDPKFNTQSPDDLLTPSTLEANLNAYLAQNNRMISIYHISEDNIVTRPVLDMCQINRNDCEHGCEFDKSTLDFVCNCPHGQILDMKHSKKCILLLDNTQGTENTSHVGILTSHLNTITSNPISDEEKPNTESVHILDKKITHSEFDLKQTEHHIAETTTENDSDLSFSHMFGDPTNQNEIQKTEISKPQLDSSEEHDLISTLEDFIQSTTMKPMTTMSEHSMTTTTHESTLEPVAEPEPGSVSQVEPKSTVVTEMFGHKIESQENERENSEHPQSNLEPETSSLPNLGSAATTLSEPQPTPEPHPTTESHTSDTKLQSPFTNSMVLEHMTTNSLEFDHMHNLTTDLPSVVMAEDKYDPKSNFNYGNQFETTTLQSSNSAPSYPELTNLNTTKHQRESHNDDYTTSENDWLEDVTDKSQTHMSKTTSPNNAFAILDHSMENSNTRSTELRSSKSFNNEFMVEDTTYLPTQFQKTDTKIEVTNGTNEDFSLEQITNHYEMPTTKMIGMENVEDSIDQSTTAVSITQIFGGKQHEILNNSFPETTTRETLTGIEETRQIFDSASMENKTNEENRSQSSIFEGVSINSNKSEQMESTTLAVETNTEYSIAKHDQKSTIDQSLITVLKKTNDTGIDEVNAVNNVTTEKDFPEGDITFDAINKLYNRSSKSFVNKNVNSEAVSETNDVYIESSETTTSSDWLSETVTEINYEETINKNKNYETTESPVTKIDYIMDRGLNKDDFEPDYLNMGSNTSKNLEHDEPLYGMLHDYDNDESAIKRVKNEPREVMEETTKNNAKETSMKENQMEKNITSLTTSTEIKNTESTTVSEYIYKKSLNSANGSFITTPDNIQITYSVPPVWENAEDNAGYTFKEVPKLTNEDTLLLSNTSVATMPITTIANIQNYSNQDKINTLDSSAPSDNVTQNNLNVTIYEISGNNNISSVDKAEHHQSAEYEDHETEMNPFLPEIENNKSLVKKLQEGHDIEPSNLNETQNENVDEQSHVASDGNMVSNDQMEYTNNKTIVSSPEQEITRTVTNENDALFNELLMHQNTHSSEEPSLPSIDMIKEMESTSSPFDDDSKETSYQPISTFLLDTDDLDTTKELLDGDNVKSENTTNFDTMAPHTLEITTENKINTGDENLFLSVVPIEQDNLGVKENMKNIFERENITEFNLISDSPKKSDGRTLESSNIQSVTNNEA